MFFITMKRLLIVLLIGVSFGSCSEYQAMLKSPNISAKYAMADSLYQAGKYKKALGLMEQIVPAYRGKPQAEKLMYIYSNTLYNLEDYILSGYQFERFETSYPSSDSVQTAAFRSARSYYELSPRFSLDQRDTYTALEKLQNFVNRYPDSEYRVQANELVSELKIKLERKDIEVANQHLKTAETFGSFKPAIESYDNFITDHPGSKYRKDAFFGRFRAAYLQAIKSIPSKVQERLVAAKVYYNNFMKYYSESDLREDADAIFADIEKRIITEPTS